MKNITLLLLFLSGALAAQTTSYETIVQPLDTKARDFSEYLVQLAWQNNPASAIAFEEVETARDKARNTRKEWMRDVQANFNFNEANLRAVDTFGNVFFPRYNIGITLNLFNILSQKDKNRIGKHDVEVAEQKVNAQMLAIRAETLSRYTQFKLAKDILKTRSLVEQETYNNFILIQQLYKTDEKTFEDYNFASSAYYQAQEARIRAQADLQLAKLHLEEIIGLRWEQIQHPGKED